jgi:tetratricopeptide (TPR) repeat protein
LNEDEVRKASKAIEDGRIDEAIRILEPLMNEDNPDPDSLVYLGIAYVQAERPEDALDVLNRAEELIEEHCVVSLFKGRALRAIGLQEEAVKELERAIRLDSEDPEAWIELGKALYSLGNYGEAARILEEAVVLFPDDPSLIGTYALALYRLGDYVRATEEWARLHELEPELMAATTNYAYVLTLQGRMDEALPIIEKACSDDPMDYRSQILKGIVHLDRGEKESATTVFLKVLESDEDNIEALSRLAVLAHERGDTQQCDEYLNRAKTQIGSALECWRGLCFAYSHLGWTEEYIACLKNWTHGDPGAAAPWIALAIEYHRSGKTQEAYHAWNESFKRRGYVRISCTKCGRDVCIDYSEKKGFNPYEEQFCTNCGTTIEMPSGLIVS